MSKGWEFRAKQAKKKEALREFSTWTTDKFITHILELREIIENFQKESPESSKVTSSETTLTEKDYKQEWSYPTKIAFLLTINQKPLTSEDLNRLLLKLDKHYKDYNSPIANLSTALQRATKSKRIIKIKSPGIKLLYYVLPDWIDREMNLNDKFKGFMKSF